MNVGKIRTTFIKKIPGNFQTSTGLLKSLNIRIIIRTAELKKKTIMTRPRGNSGKVISFQYR